MTAAPPPEVAEQTLREVVETLAAIERPPCSDGERRAAEWLADRLRQAGCSRVELEEEDAWGGYLSTAAGLGLVASAGTLLALRGRHMTGLVMVLGAASALVDDVQNGARFVRRIVRRRRTAVNVVARCGDAGAARTLVVLAHHDAHQSGRFYDQGLQQAIYRLAPHLLDRLKTSPPQWWLGLVGPALSSAGALGRSRGLLYGGLALTLLATAVVTEIASNPTVPGANDNLSGVAALVALAESRRQHPSEGVSLLLVSCGAEESLQEGIRGFVPRHRGQLAADRTWFLNLETVGSPRLIMLEGEGPIWMEDYHDPAFRGLVSQAAADAGVELERGFRARASTDSVVPSRAGYPTATLTSVTPWGALANYHLPSDTPENVDYSTVRDAVRVANAVQRALADL
jgi:Zn-dependent M28 family amino/carboxypeptidase